MVGITRRRCKARKTPLDGQRQRWIAPRPGRGLQGIPKHKGLHGDDMISPCFVSRFAGGPRRGRVTEDKQRDQDTKNARSLRLTSCRASLGLSEMKTSSLSCRPDATRPIQTRPPGLAPRFPRALPQIPTSSVDLARYRAHRSPRRVVHHQHQGTPQVRTNLSSAQSP